MNIEPIIGLPLSILFVVALGYGIYRDNHNRTHLFVAHCPLCRKDPYRMALMADQLGMTRERELLWDAATAPVEEPEDDTPETKDD